MTVFLAYTTEQAARLARVTPRRVSYWARSGVLVPGVVFDPSTPANAWLYSFADIVGLRTLGILRDRFGLPLQRLRQAANYLAEHAEHPWSELRLWVRGKNLLFHEPASGQVLSTQPPGQTAIAIELEPVARDVEREGDLLAQRNPADIGQVERRRTVQNNRLVIKGTRMPVDTIIAFADAGYSNEQIVESFPSLTLDDVTIVLARYRAA